MPACRLGHVAWAETVPLPGHSPQQLPHRAVQLVQLVPPPTWQDQLQGAQLAVAPRVLQGRP